MIFETEDLEVTCNDDQPARDALFERVMQFFKETELFWGESVAQSDRTGELAPELLADIADNILQFKVGHKP
jgi:hypothetical protein